MKNILVSEQFKKMTIRAILSICLFLFTYLVLILLGIAFTILCSFGGMSLIAFKPMFLTIIVGAGLIIMGILVLIFLFKFIFKKNVVDRSHLVEITAKQEPELFNFIQTIVNEVKTDFPKKIYLSSDVNASVFYDSSFWSMFFPIKKNLQIGIGLVNAVSVDEFKAILAHEFGHFSQRTMKVGSYVYNVNQVIYNLLYENTSFEALAQKLGNIHDYFTFFVGLSFKIVEGIQWVLRKVYDIVNLSYMSLSREMEFHADEVAANVAGSEPLITALLRLDLANHSYNVVLNYYNDKIPEAVKTTNIYPQHQFVMNFLAEESKLPTKHELPQVNLEHYNRFNKTKLVIKNQWASHPNTEDRIEALKRLNISTQYNNTQKATVLFKAIDSVQEKITTKLFDIISYNAEVTNEKIGQFIESYTKDYKANSFDIIFNNYYDNKNPSYFEIENLVNQPLPTTIKFEDIFSNQAVDLVYTEIATESDIHTLKQIKNEEVIIKSFDYDGVKYSANDCDDLIPVLEKELSVLKEQLLENDKAIFQYFLSLAQLQGLEKDYIEHYMDFFNLDKNYDAKYEIYVQLMNDAAFISQTTPFEIIEEKMLSLKKSESTFREQLSEMLKEDIYQTVITDEIKDNLTNYLSKDWIYFTTPVYDNTALDILYTSVQQYSFILGKTFFVKKKSLLDFKVKLYVNDK